jgi:DNA-binding phage protein
MPLTRSFKETVVARVRADRSFRRELLKDGIECLLAGDVDTGKAVLRDYIHATIGFRALGKAIHISEKSLLRMFGPSGNPQAKNLFHVVAYLQQVEGIRLQVKQRAA